RNALGSGESWASSVPPNEALRSTGARSGPRHLGAHASAPATELGRSVLQDDGGIMKRRWRWVLLVFVLGAILVVVYVRTNPLVFNESLWQHAHCIKIAGLELEQYAEANGGKFPSHPKGYGNALLLLNADCYFALTGPGYDAAAFHEAKRSGSDLPEE